MTSYFERFFGRMGKFLTLLLFFFSSYAAVLVESNFGAAGSLSRHYHLPFLFSRGLMKGIEAAGQYSMPMGLRAPS